MTERATLLAAGLLGAVCLAGCMSWETAYPEVTEAPPVAGTAALLAEADRLAGEAGDRARLESAVAAYERVLESDGGHFRALCELGHLYVLLGAAYGEGSSEKGRFYKQGADYNARAMYTNPEFRKLVDAGESLADASRVLGKREMDAMGFWCQSLFYYYKECLSILGRIVNFKWILAAQTVFARMGEVDPEWQRGGLDFSLGIVYIALPSSAGGDKAKAKEYVDGAVAKHPDVIRNRWGRAKYYCSVVGDREAFRKDLEWVLEQDPRGWGPYPWNVYFQADARMMLDEIDETFG